MCHRSEFIAGYDAASSERSNEFLDAPSASGDIYDACQGAFPFHPPLLSAGTLLDELKPQSCLATIKWSLIHDRSVNT